MRILMVEDDARFAKLTAEFLSDAGYLVEHAFSINDCNDLLGIYDYDLYIVDLEFPD
jgi:DNA-binding response OmpR family regulator